MLGGFFVNSAFAQQNTQRADDTPLKLTLHDALQIALSDNPTVRVAEQEVKKTTYAKNKAWAALFPKVDLNGNYSYTIKKQKMYFGGMKFPGMGGSPGGNGGNNDQNSSANNAIAIEVGVRHSIQTGIQAGMPLIAPQLWSSLSINAAEVELAKEKSRGSKVDMTAEVRKAYYTALLANEAYRVYRQSYDNAQENYRQIKEKYERGLVAQYDLLRTEVQMKNIEPNVV
ncbi:type I secretion outer membrane protein, TolC family [Porphyromonas macacae]|uniref:Type I secretion outer membrane protein, TolC family n=3 Tax=Porphyromonas macacae TaxID=28115 RepID=A0A379DKG9_9PORP|nr:type I secretion outer membrane protein, TolC family [Porphyromonas macacae]